MRPGEERLDGPPIHGNTQLEVIWTALPSALIAALVVYAAIVLHDIGVKQPNEIAIGVTGPAVGVAFSYPGYHDAQGKPIVTYSSTCRQPPGGLQDPLGRRDTHLLGSGLPAAGGRGARHHDQFPRDPDRLGSYPVICTQLCGYGHSTMRTTLHIVTAAAFSTWLAEHGYSGYPRPDRVRAQPGDADPSAARTATTAAGPTRPPRRDRNDRPAPRPRTAPGHPCDPARHRTRLRDHRRSARPPTITAVLDGTAILQVAMITAPFAFLIGLGAFDYWFHWAIGRPTRPEDHSGHGARTLEGLLPRQHRPQGDRRPVRLHSFPYFLIAGLFAMLMRVSSPSRAASSSTRTPTTACSRSTRR